MKYIQYIEQQIGSVLQLVIKCLMKKASLVDKDRILHIPSEYSVGNLCVQGRTCKTRNVLNPSNFSSGLNEGFLLPANLPSHVLIAINIILPSVM